MIVRNSQIESFRPQTEAAYVKSAADYLARRDPVLSASAGRKGLEQTAELGLEKARRHDLLLGPALQIYLELMMSLGSGFDVDPQYRWFRPLLDPREGMGSVERARLLDFHTSAYLSRVQGVGNRFVRAALERAHEHLVRFTDGGTLVETEPIGILTWLHPQRLDFVDPEAAAELLNKARRDAQAAGFPPRQGEDLLLLLMFMFGSEVASDPLYPWIGETLKAHEPGAERLNRLAENAKNYVSAILSAMKQRDI